MNQYPEERRNAMIRKMLSPDCPSIAQLARDEGISKWTLYDWRKQAIDGAQRIPMPDKPADPLSAEARFAIVVETATMSEAELSQYCRESGFYPENVKAWKRGFITGSASEQTASSTSLQKERRRIKELEQELRRKEKALAETAALLVLRKKADAIWGKGEDE